MAGSFGPDFSCPLATSQLLALSLQGHVLSWLSVHFSLPLSPSWCFSLLSNSVHALLLFSVSKSDAFPKRSVLLLYFLKQQGQKIWHEQRLPKFLILEKMDRKSPLWERAVAFRGHSGTGSQWWWHCLVCPEDSRAQRREGRVKSRPCMVFFLQHSVLSLCPVPLSFPWAICTPFCHNHLPWRQSLIVTVENNWSEFQNSLWHVDRLGTAFLVVWSVIKACHTQ